MGQDLRKETMKAVIVPSPGILEVSEVPMAPKPGKGEVMIKMKAGGICGSDVHVYHGRSAFATYPRILGHEIAGEVVESGEGADTLAAGAHVVIDPVTSCGECYACRIGRHNVCRSVKVLAAHVDGGFRQYMTVSVKNAHVISKDIPWDLACTAEPYSIAAEATDRGSLTADDRALICGAGPIGIVILQAAKMIGAKVMVLDNVGARLEKAKQIGADEIVDSAKEDVTRRVMDWTGGEGASVIFEATGNIGIMESCVSAWPSQAGRVVVLGFPNAPMSVVPLDIMRRELDIRGSRLNRDKFPEVVAWLEKGLVHPAQMITHRFPFEKARDAMDQIAKDPVNTMKVILEFE